MARFPRFRVRVPVGDPAQAPVHVPTFDRDPQPNILDRVPCTYRHRPRRCIKGLAFKRSPHVESPCMGETNGKGDHLRVAERGICAGWEVICPDGLSRHYPYHNYGDAESHTRRASDPGWFARRGCRLAPKASARELSMPPCPGGRHLVVALPIVHPRVHGRA